MVGNDIVDIDLASLQSNWKRPKYLDKIFTTKEQALITHSTDPSTMVWQLWSMKEAAYKLYTQLNPSRFYNPRAFECNLNKNSTVTYNEFKCYVKTNVTSKYIVSEARLNQGELHSKVVDLMSGSPKSQSKFLIDQLLDLASCQIQCDKKDLKFVKRKYGIPTLHYKTNVYNVSLSHHGRFGTIAFAY